MVGLYVQLSLGSFVYFSQTVLLSRYFSLLLIICNSLSHRKCSFVLLWPGVCWCWCVWSPQVKWYLNTQVLIVHTLRLKPPFFCCFVYAFSKNYSFSFRMDGSSLHFVKYLIFIFYAVNSFKKKNNNNYKTEKKEIV